MKRFIVGLTICILSIIGIVFISGVFNDYTAKNLDRNKPEDRDITCLEDICITIDINNHKEIISPIVEEPDKLYYVVPASTDSFTFSFLKDGDVIELSGKTICSGEKLNSEDYVGKDFSFSILSQELETEGSISFAGTSSVSSLFIETEVKTEELDSEKGLECKASLTEISGKGKVKKDGIGLEYIKTRGNSTFYLPKKPYEIRFSKKSEICGLPKDKEFILLANYLDDILLRNCLVYDFANDYTPLVAPKGEFVDLFINGEYIGDYYLCQKVKGNCDILNLNNTKAFNENAGVDNNSQLITDEIMNLRGYENTGKVMPDAEYLVEISATEQAMEKNAYFVGDDGRAFGISFPGNATIDEVRALKQLFSETNKALDATDGINPETGRHFSEYLDVESFLYKGLLESVFENSDSNSNSIYMYIKNENGGMKVYAGPCWDYDLIAQYGVSEWNTDIVGKVYLVDKLLRFPEVKEQYRDILESVFLPYVKYDLPYKAYSGFENIKDSYECDLLKWKTKGMYEDSIHDVDYLVSRTQERIDVIKSQILGDNPKHKVTFLDYYGNPLYLSCYVEDGATIDSIPTLASYVAVFDGWYRQDNGEKLNAETLIFEDVVYESRWIDVSLLIENGADALGTDVSNLSPEQFESIAEYIRCKQNEVEE